jgi:riboflavin transporter FmnP
MNAIKKQKIIIQAAMLAALSIVLYFVPSIPTEWGMSLDFVAIPWLISLLLLGGWGGFLTAIVSSGILSVTAASGWLGMLAKFLATGTFMLAIVAFRWHFKKLTPKVLLAAFVAGVILRCAVMVFSNYYYFLPIWMNITAVEAIAQFPAWVIIAPNLIQSVIDMVIPVYLLFGTKLRKRMIG